MGKKTLHQNGEKPLGFRGFVMATVVTDVLIEELKQVIKEFIGRLVVPHL
jgi:hypothetical protein